MLSVGWSRCSWNGMWHLYTEFIVRTMAKAVVVQEITKKIEIVSRI